MSRLDQIQILSRRYWNLMGQRKLKSASMIKMRMCELMHKELRAENRASHD